MPSTDTLLQSYRVCTRRRSLTGWYSPPVAGWQAQPDGVVSSYLHSAIPLLWRGVKLRLTGWYSPPMEGCQAPPDGVVFPSYGGVAGAA